MLRQRPRLHRLLHFGHWTLSYFARQTLLECSPREYSNAVLRRFLAELQGKVINVSGWEDSDREGDFYRNYYGSWTRYVVSNVEGERGAPRTRASGVESLVLDLDQPLAPELHGEFDIAFSHTVIEHIFDPHRSLDTIASLTTDIAVTVVPFSQQVHYSATYGDYVRLTPLFLKRFFEERGFSVLLSTFNDQPFVPIYVVFIASRRPDRHRRAFRDAPFRFEPQIFPRRWGRSAA